jgi:hypothetical protein
MRTYGLVIFLIALILSACSPKKTLSGVDSQAWKDDYNGCQGKRLALREAVEASKLELLGWTEAELISVLGRPERTDLKGRNQKSYLYCLSPGPKCKDGAAVPAVVFDVRFNAINQVCEAAVVVK